MANSRFSDGLKGLGKASGKPAAPIPEAAPVHAAEPAGPPPSRQGKVAISAYFDPAVRKQFAILAIKEGKSQQALLADALNLLFREHGEGEIARA